MLEKLRVVFFAIPELRQRILITLMLLAVFRIGYQIPLPWVDQEAFNLTSSGEGGINDFIKQVSVFSAANLNMPMIFGLGIMPYISASIILQLLSTIWKPLETLRKEGQAGQKKINQYTRLLTVVLCLFQSFVFLRFSLQTQSGDAMALADFTSGGQLTAFWQVVSVLTMTAGSVFLMWLGEQIDEHGIGNGISLLIMAGILAAMPSALIQMANNFQLDLAGLGEQGVETILILAVLFVAVVMGVVFITLGQRQIPIQSAKHVKGRRVYGGTRSYLPLRINQAGVMPIIFASSLLMVPAIVFQYLEPRMGTWGWAFRNLSTMFGRGESFVYNALYVLLIYVFCYFWTAISFNPKEVSENLRDNGSFIPGYRPGRQTADYLNRVIERITYVGAGFLSIVAIVPTLVSSMLNVDYIVASFYGGTSLLIAVSVAFDLVQKIDSYLVMRNHRGLMET